ELINLFSVALLIGIAIGTYSSIFVASPLVVLWERMSNRAATTKREDVRLSGGGGARPRQTRPAPPPVRPKPEASRPRPEPARPKPEAPIGDGQVAPVGARTTSAPTSPRPTPAPAPIPPQPQR